MIKDLGIVDLLQIFGFDPTCRSKLVRHQDRRWDSHDLFRRGWLDTYQCFQSRPVFDNVDFVISFLGVGGTQARLIGIYKVLGRSPGSSGRLPDGCPYAEWRNSSYFYELARQPEFETLENRVVIEWGRAAQAWHQYTTNKRVDRVLPKGQLLRPFTDYLDFTLTHKELRYLVDHQEANSEWRFRLSAVAGVYLILATTTGRQYIGSATGSEGFWGRLAAYVANGHGGNVLLRDLVLNDSAYPDSFTYSLLQILPKSTTAAETLEWEQLYKMKLGSIATGLNAN
jgi:hypothetical protein